MTDNKKAPPKPPAPPRETEAKQPELTAAPAEPAQPSPEQATVIPIPMPSEARYICWFDMYGHKTSGDKEKGEPVVKHEVRMNVTVRGFETAVDFAKDIKATVKAMRDELQLELYSTLRKEAPQGAPAGKAAPVAPGSKPPPPGVQTAPPPRSAPEKEQPTGGTESIDSVTIKPEPDGKVTVEFNRANLRYPVLKMAKRPNDKVLEILPSGWTEDYLFTPATYNVLWKVRWAQGKATQSGKGFYKDVVEIIQQ